MILGSHVIISAYGFWLPNDPRGSWSDFVGSWELFRFGKATKVDTHHSLASQKHNHGVRLSAKRVLKYPPVKFDGKQVGAIGRGFADCVEKNDMTIWACSILSEHVHLVVARHDYDVRQIVNQLKGYATRQLAREEVHPMRPFSTKDNRLPKVWGRGCWVVYLSSEADIKRAIRYVDNNPSKEGKPLQRWGFVNGYG